MFILLGEVRTLSRMDGGLHNDEGDHEDEFHVRTVLTRPGVGRYAYIREAPTSRSTTKVRFHELGTNISSVDDSSVNRLFYFIFLRPTNVSIGAPGSFVGRGRLIILVIVFKSYRLRDVLFSKLCTFINIYIYIFRDAFR